MKVKIGPYTEYDSKTGIQPDRKIKVVIDKYDTFSAYSTLAIVITSVLRKYKKKSKSFGAVDNADVPEKLRNDETHDRKRWKYVLNEMIWAMSQIAREYPDEPNLDYNIIKIGFDKYNAYHKRVDNGCRLFGKYFQSLWS